MIATIVENIQFDIHHLNGVLLIGVAIFFGTVGARFFQKFRIPQVVGYVVIGLVLGESGFGLVGDETIEALSGFSMFALGIIGFMIGGELRKEIFKKYGKQLFIILLAEGIGAFILVGLLCGSVAWFFTHNTTTSIAMGLVLGAIASATAPAATVHVLWEYKTRGALTRTILAIVALDDGLALLLFGVASSVAAALLGNLESSLSATIVAAGYEIVGAIALGVLAGFILGYILKHITEPDKALAFIISSVLLVIGFSMALKLGSIMAAMVLGVTITNFAPRRRKSTFELVEKFAPPIYVLFFVLAGAHLVIGEIKGWMIVMVIVYVLARTAGKMLGCWFGASKAKAPDVVRKYLGLCLLSQAGVAIGLTIMSSRLFGDDAAGSAIIVIVMTTTFIVEIFGPMFVKLGVGKAGEIGMDVTADDLIAEYTVREVMDTNPATIGMDLPLESILDTFSHTDSVYYPVIDAKSYLHGIITIAGIKDIFACQQVAGWLLACDVAQPVLDKTSPNSPLAEALKRMKKFNLEYMPVVTGADANEFLGVLDYRSVNRKISAEVLRRKEAADEMAPA